MRVVIDTNIWISYLISKDLIWIDDYIKSDDIKLLFSKQLLAEFLVVAKRPKLQRYFKEEKLKHLLKLFDSFGLLISVRSKVDICRDPSDNFLLELAIDGNADFLVTGDKDLTTIGTINNCKIITLSKLKTLLR